MRRLPWAKRKKAFEALRHVPTEGQMLIHETDVNNVIMAGGVGAGKSMVAGVEMAVHLMAVATKEGVERALAGAPPEKHEAILKGLQPIKEGNLFILAGPSYEVPQTEFKEVRRFLQKLRLIEKVSAPKTGPWELTTVSGATLVTRTLSDPEDIRAWNCEGVCICEAGKVEEDSYLAMLQRIFRTDGFLIMTGTIEESQPWYQEKLLEWESADDKISVCLPSWSNTYAVPGGEFDESIERMAIEYGGRDSTLFQQKVAAKLVKPGGLVIRNFNYRLHVKDVRWNRGDVELAIDPGSRHTYAVEVIQSAPHGQIQVIDEIYVRDLVTEQIIDICKDKPWWNKVKGGVIDRSAADRRGHTKSTVWQLWRDAGVPLRYQYVSVQDGIDRIDAALGIHPGTGEPKLVINPNCKGLIYEMGGLGRPPISGMGPWKRNELGGGNYGKPQDINDDATKTMGYYLVDRHGKIRPERALLPTKYSSGATWRR